jgi:RNase H-fold protein (predicted Holliday junction resolvase)
MLQEEQRTAGRGGKSYDLTRIDHLAAALILQSWLQAPDSGQPP